MPVPTPRGPARTRTERSRRAFVMRLVPRLLALLLVGAGVVLVPSAAQAVAGCESAVIANTKVRLGVNCLGDLGTPGQVGLQYVPTGGEAVSQGCSCEGWGVADLNTQITGYVNESSRLDGSPGTSANVSPVSFNADSATAVSVVEVGSTFRVTQDFHPSPSTPNLYEVSVTVMNISAAPTHLRYRRVMDWDIAPTPFHEFVTLQKGTSPRVVFTSDDGFADSNPLAGESSVRSTGSFVDSGPVDHGALFDFDFGQIPAGTSRAFKIFYGAASTEARAATALNAVNAEAYSFGQPDDDPDFPTQGPASGQPNTFVFAFRDIDGASIFAPFAVTDTAKAFTAVPKTIKVLANDSDPNGDPLTVTGHSSPLHGTATCSATDCTYTSDDGYTGSDSFVYDVSDGNGGTASATVSLTVTPVPVNKPPVATADTVTLDEDGTATVDVLANDTDPDVDDVLSIETWTQPAHGSVTCTTTCSYRPNANYHGPDSFSYDLTDGKATVTGTVSVTVRSVNDAPVAMNDASARTAEDTALDVPVTLNDIDVDGDTLSAVVVTAPANGTVACSGGSCHYVPAGNFFGTDTFTYRAYDGTAYSAPATVTVEVTPVNDAPVARPDSLGVGEDGSATLSVLANDTDVESDTLGVTDHGTPAHGTVTCTATACTYQPTANYTGPDSFTYTVSDGTDTAIGTVTVTVSAVNDPPVAQPDVVAVDEDTTAVVSVTGNDTDADADPLSAVLASPAARGTATCAGGTCTYVPDPNTNGVDTFTYRASDGQSQSGAVTVTVTVRAVNDAPIALPDTASTTPGQAVDVDVLGNDSDVDSAPLRIAGSTTPQHGTLTCDTACHYTPADGFEGVDTFTYDVSDGAGGTATATVTLTVAKVNHAPQPGLDEVGTVEDNAADFSVLGNDTDPDVGDTLTLTDVDNTTTGGGLVSCDASGACTYLPADNVNGTDTFTYTVTDNQGVSATGQVLVDVTPVNDKPVARADLVSVNRDVRGSMVVVTNDTDIDGDVLTVSAPTLPAHGTVTCTAAGTCLYTPARHYAGTDTFRYTVSDGHGGSTSAWVTVTVKATVAKPDPPRSLTAKPGAFVRSGKHYNLQVAWKAPLWNGGGTISGYRLLAKKYSGAKVVSTKYVTLKTSPLSAYVALPKGVWTFQLTAENSAGYGTYTTVTKKLTLR